MVHKTRTNQTSLSAMRLINKLLFTAFLILNSYHLNVLASGVFELRLASFANDLSRDAIGNCCGNALKADGFNNNNEKCGEKCQTFFRVCLKHYQTNIDPSPPCTYGEVITNVFNESSINFKDITVDHTIRFPFNFSWPGTFSLIVEAWHNASASSSSLSTSSRGVTETRTRTLITRLAMSRYLKVDTKWTQKSAHNNHTSLNYQYRVVCEEGYFGDYCDTHCKPRDDSYGHYGCGLNGDKQCNPGWHGIYCDKDSYGHYGCGLNGDKQCNPGWHGIYCDKGHNCNQCTKYPGCLHGYCSKPWDCLCQEGWGGLLCNQDLNYCTNHKPCKNGGSCTNTGQGWYTCDCPLGYTGKNCEQEIDSCAHNPCANGATCKSTTSNNYTCECPLGYSGKHCETMASICTNNPCSNGATCLDGPSGYLCICKPGYEGEHCQKRQTDCDPNPCNNGGSCVTVGADQYECRCRAGYTGDHCEININDCDANPCLNSGTCIDGENTFRCLCVPGFIGDLCQDNVDDCLAKPCANGGQCLDLVNDYQCECGPGFAGKDCSLNLNECESNPCLNGGLCVDGVDEYECRCPSGYTGDRCQQPVITSKLSQSLTSNTLNDSAVAPPTVAEIPEPLTTKQWVVISLASVAVPVLTAIAALSILYCKRRKSRLQSLKRKDEEEVRRQNEQNFVTSMNNKCADGQYMAPNAGCDVIVNALDRHSSLSHLARGGKSATLSKLTNHEIYDSIQNVNYQKQQQQQQHRQLSVNEKYATLASLKKTVPNSSNKVLNTVCTAVDSRPVVNNKLCADSAGKVMANNHYDNNSHHQHHYASHLVVSQSPMNAMHHSQQNNITNHMNSQQILERRGSLPQQQHPPPHHQQNVTKYSVLHELKV
ncbi:unnamed protein product [Oppiella nova]|uniref:Delta-like protein n=1 Tax=Oppiella nova TaxID=334625 RepID=A0A7R9LB91_9ACAR|nr:unnamed protein product [Oppiella nova]CAG2161670.1 unnamed protein product [Oppiella nova]